MQKTPDEIKKGLAECTECCELQFCPRSAIHEDALAYIQQLEAANAELLTRCERLERERDAAVADIELCDSCEVCKHAEDDAEYFPCGYCYHINKGLTSYFEWRGVKEE